MSILEIDDLKKYSRLVFKYKMSTLCTCTSPGMLKLVRHNYLYQLASVVSLLVYIRLFFLLLWKMRSHLWSLCCPQIRGCIMLRNRRTIEPHKQSLSIHDEDENHDENHSDRCYSEGMLLQSHSVSFTKACFSTLLFPSFPLIPLDVMHVVWLLPGLNVADIAK